MLPGMEDVRITREMKIENYEIFDIIAKQNFN